MHKIKLFSLAIFFSFAMNACATQDPPLHGNNYRSIEAEALQVHNHFRSLHNAQPLVWDDTLARYAQHWANQCHFKHSSPPYGENIARGYKTMTEAVDRWYGEQSLYSYSHPTFSAATGHFTQVVWKSSRRLGCAYAPCNGRNGLHGIFWVCEYSPAGNVINAGYFAANVS